MLFSSKPMTIPSADAALPGRASEIPTASMHFINGRPLKGPIPEGMEQVMFGMGWGLVGLCPGPSIAALSYGGTGLYIFVAAMVAGMVLTPQLRKAMS